MEEDEALYGTLMFEQTVARRERTTEIADVIGALIKAPPRHA